MKKGIIIDDQILQSNGFLTEVQLPNKAIILEVEAQHPNLNHKLCLMFALYRTLIENNYMNFDRLLISCFFFVFVDSAYLINNKKLMFPS